MEKEKMLRLLIRQLKDIQSQADKILTGENSEEAIENFSRYSEELKDFINNNIDSTEIKNYTLQLPVINLERTTIKSIQLWQYLVIPIMPWWWFSAYKNYQAKNKIVEEIGEVRSRYATLEWMVRGMED